MKRSSITLDIVKHLRRGQTVTVQCLDSNSWTVTIRDLNSNSSNIKKGMITMVGQRTTIWMSVMKEKCKILRNDWKKDLLVVDMVIIKHILEWGKIFR